MLRILAAVACGLAALLASLAAWFVASLQPYQVARLPEGVTPTGLLAAALLVAALALGGLVLALRGLLRAGGASRGAQRERSAERERKTAPRT